MLRYSPKISTILGNISSHCNAFATDSAQAIKKKGGN